MSKLITCFERTLHTDFTDPDTKRFNQNAFCHTDHNLFLHTITTNASGLRNCIRDLHVVQNTFFLHICDPWHIQVCVHVCGLCHTHTHACTQHTHTHNDHTHTDQSEASWTPLSPVAANAFKLQTNKTVHMNMSKQNILSVSSFAGVFWLDQFSQFKWSNEIHCLLI